MSEALLGLHRICRDVIFLGSYARADQQPADIPMGFTDSDFHSAAEWLASLEQPNGHV